MLTRWAAWDAEGRGRAPTAPLVVGSAPWSGDDLTFLRIELGVTSVISLQSDEDLGARGLAYSTLWALHAREGLRAARLPIRDYDLRDLQRHLDAAIQLVEAELAAGHRVYLHCSAGLNRSPTAAVGVRARTLGSLEAAQAELIEVHPEAVIATGALKKWAKKNL